MSEFQSYVLNFKKMSEISSFLKVYEFNRRDIKEKRMSTKHKRIAWTTSRNTLNKPAGTYMLQVKAKLCQDIGQSDK